MSFPFSLRFAQGECGAERLVPALRYATGEPGTRNGPRCHVFLCMLAYYIQWHMNQRLKPLFQSDGKNKHRRWTFENVIERLKSVRREIVTVEDTNCRVVSTPDEEQKKILDLLKVTL